MASMVRAAALRGLVPLLERLGGDGATLLGRFGITAEAVDSDDAVIRTSALSRLLEASAAELSCPDLGLRLAGQQNAGVLGPLAIAVENSRSISDALDTASRFLFVHSPTLTVALVPDPEAVRGVRGLRYGSTDPVPISPQATDLGIGLLHRIIALPFDGHYGLRSVHLPHPPIAPLARYTGFFGADVRFDREAAVLRLPEAVLDTPVQGGNEMLRALAIDFLEGHFPEPGRLVTPRVRSAIHQALGSSQVGIGPVARLLRLHPRTLQRYLAAEGTTFDAVLDDVRRETAHRLVTGTDLRFTQIAAMVGFAEQSALTRATRRWYGDTPRALRASARRA